MKRKLLYLGVLAISIFFIPKVEAATSVNVSTNKSSVVVGNNVTVTVTYSSSNLLAQVYGTFTYNSSVFKYVSGSEPAISWVYVNGNTTKTQTYTYTLRAIASGSSTFSVSNASVYLLDGDSLAPISPSVSSSSTTVISQSQLEATYSKNNYLASLGVEGYELSPTFNKDTLEYTAEVPNGITKVVINASKEDGSASINGIGEREVTEGVNKIEIKVTAQNGNERTYIINLAVKELDPVKVIINKKEYTVVRKEGVMDLPSATYEKTTASVEGTDVLAFYSDITKYTLVGLKDEEGNTDYYIYDKNTFTLYKEYNFNGVILNIKEDTNNIPLNYKKTKVTINDDTINCYKVDTSNINTSYAIGNDYKSDEFYLFYALNVDTGKEALYVLDKEENTVQRYNDDEVSYYKEKADKYFILVLALGGVIALTIITLSIILIKNSHKKNK